MAAGPGRKLVLFRHAKSAWPDVPDHERPLARRGLSDAPIMGHWLRSAGCVPDQVLCSTARRARQTWQFAETGLGASPPVSYERGVYGASAAELLDLIRPAPAATTTLLVIGHDPGIKDLALMLTATAAGPGGDAHTDSVPAATFDRIRAKFPTAAIAVIEFTGAWSQLGPGRARMTCFVTPREGGAGSAARRPG